MEGSSEKNTDIFMGTYTTCKFMNAGMRIHITSR